MLLLSCQSSDQLPSPSLPCLRACLPGPDSRFCPGSAGCTSKLHSPSEPLRLVFTLDNSTLLSKTSFSWVSSDIALTAASTTKQASTDAGLVWHVCQTCAAEGP